MRISVLALEGVFDTGLTVTLDALTLANKLSVRQMGGTPPFDVSLVGVRRKVRSGQGLAIPVQAVTAALKPDWVIVPALSTGTPELLVPALGRPDMKQAKAQLLKWHAEGAQIARPVSGLSLWRKPGFSIIAKRRRPGGSRRCSGNAIRMCCSTNLACSCRQTEA
jgi:hypothetical protein